MSRLSEALARGEFVVTAELSPPKGTELGDFLGAADLLRPRVHALNVTDNNRSIMRMSSVAASRLLLDRDVEPVCQLTCRDRNRLALQSDLLGAHALGVRSVLCLGGDRVQVGDHPDAPGVFDLDALGLLRAIGSLNTGVDVGGNALEGPTDLLAGAAADPNPPAEAIERNLAGKVEAGARFFQTQFSADLASYEKLARIAERHRAPIVAGVFLVKSAKNARFLNEKVPGISIPESVIARFERAERPLEEGIAWAAEMIRGLRGMVQGVHVYAVKAEGRIPEILDRAAVGPVLPAQG